MKKLLLCPICYTVGLVVLALLLLLSCTIPSEWLHDNARESAEYILETEDSFYDIERGGAFAYQRLDNYADMMLFNIAVTVDSSHPLDSMLAARYLLDPYRKSASLVVARIDGEAPNADYSRYWHGMLVFLRPLLCVMDYNAMRVLNAFVMCGVVGWLCALLCRRKMAWYALALVASIVLTDFMTTPLCFEFYIMSILSLIFTALVLIIDGRRVRDGGFVEREWHLLVYFTLVGLATCFFDFLTAETLTLLLPLISVIVARTCDGDGGQTFSVTPKQVITLIIGAALCWGMAYALTYVVKWGLAAALCEDISFADAIGYAGVRAVGEVEKAVFPLPIEALLRNIAMLPVFSMPGTDMGIFAIVGIIAGVALVGLVLCGRKPRELGLPLIIASLALVPYVRYVVLCNHSTLHHFFTYRAQAASILALISAARLAVDPKIIRKESKHK